MKEALKINKNVASSNPTSVQNWSWLQLSLIPQPNELIVKCQMNLEF